ncbi:hypothetical protein ILUMI_12274 [Ignelater luminosus]|uniref:Transcription factor TFIIIC triple barrel domain-containing protein n=1 Tax=Ignelater luminosus TaxID=2038154 RepID=A0A8K0CYX1_IGNLU|nr:hypothetical protein ILUMI_12274 [Ignelater luminosus]
MTQEYEEQDVYVLLDFQGKDSSRLLKQPNIYFRMLNLNESKPVVEIGEDIYEGTYDDAVGTNVYFEECEDPPPNQNAFEAITPITLNYLLKQTKILKMEKIGIKAKPVMNMNPTEMVDINIKDDYRVLLEKYENNKLNIEEYVVDEKISEEDSEDKISSDKSDEEEQPEEWKSTQLPARQSSVPEWYSSNGDQVKSKPEPTDPTYLKYIKLQRIAEQPTKHKKIIENIEDNKNEPPLWSLPKNDFITWKNLIMQKVEQQQINLDINKDKVEDFVDIKDSIKAGIIAPSNANPRVFTKEEKQELLSFKNFINVSPLMKLIMLEDYVRLEKAAIEQMTPEQLNEMSEDDCTVQEKFKLLENFKDELKGYILLRLQDESNDTEQLQKDIDLLKLSDDEDMSDLDDLYSSDDDDDEQNSASDSEQDEESSYVSDEMANKMDVDKV